MKEVFHFIKQLHSFSGKVLYTNLLGMVIISLLDGLGTVLLVPMLNMSGILTTNDSSSMWAFLDFFKGFSKEISLPTILAVYIVLVIGQNLLEKANSIQSVKIHQGFINKIKEETYQSLLHVRWEFYLKTRKSDLINSLTKDINRISIGLKMFTQLITNLIFTFIQIGIAFWLSPQISSLILACGIGLAFFSWRFVKQAKAIGKEGTQLSRKYLAGITDNINGMKDIKTNTIELSRSKWLTSLNQKMLNEQVHYVKLQANSQLSYKTALAVIITSFIFLSVHFVHTGPAKIVVVILIFSRLWPRFVNIQANLQQIASASPSFKILLDLQNKVMRLVENHHENFENIKPLSVHNMIECRHVFFRYSRLSPTFVLRDINLQIPANGMTAIVGKSGAGKSTLVDTLIGLNRPESGEVLIDGIPLNDDNLIALRKSIGFVPQDPFVFNESIRTNLLLMEPRANEEHMWQALEFAAADDFVKRLPKGLDTIIGDRGIRLSGGERQRLVLARAILRRPSILILDEATSALDTNNEAKIQQALERLKGKITIIVIAHRLSTIRNADQVLVLDQGEIVQTGSFKELSNNKNGMFNHFLSGQLKVNEN